MKDSSAQATDDVEFSEENTDSEMRRLVEITKLLEMRMMIPCPCQLVQEKFLVWIYQAFPHLGNYAKKSLNSPLSISRLLRWHTAKSDNIIEGDPFKYKGRITKVVHPYLIPIVRETK
ncbi:hypothetical protein H5410_062052 [Solanum commersonii]|uniref:Uncharacterized protein n=1 Tax=Solanum commersonii TaxID=4109 RepID=A0A9J5WBG4_SOLCO|nr:hypothetical protein H5410_062052 [Solanum commersonii]